MNLIGTQIILFYSSFMLYYYTFSSCIFFLLTSVLNSLQVKIQPWWVYFFEIVKLKKTDSEKWLVSSGRGERVQQPIQKWLRTPHGQSLQACTQVPGFFSPLKDPRWEVFNIAAFQIYVVIQRNRKVHLY